MSVRITSDEEVVALYDNVSGFAFGEVFDSTEEATSFLEWCETHVNTDLRKLTNEQLIQARAEWTAYILEHPEGEEDGNK
jgi:hypothetical protein